MTWPSILFSMLCCVILGAAVMGLATRSGTRTSIAWFLLSMSSIAGVLILLGANVIAIAQLFFCAGIGLVTFIAVEDSNDDDIWRGSDPDFGEGGAIGGSGGGFRDWLPRSWHWLLVTLGVAGASVMWTLVFRILPGDLAGTQHDTALMQSSSFETVGHSVLVDQGVALLVVGLLLLAALIGSGYLVRRGPDE